MRILLILVFLSSSEVVFSQLPPNIEWQKCLGGTLEDQANSIQVTSDGGYIVAGYTFSNNGDVSGNHGGGDFWIVKLNADGMVAWQRTCGGSGQDEANSIQATSDGGYIVAGYTYSTTGDVTSNHGDADYWLIKLNSVGTIIWQKTYGGSGEDVANFVQTTSDGGYIVAGYTYSTDGDIDSNNGSEDHWIVKLDSNGTLLWQETYGGSQSESARSILQTSDGGYMVVGDILSSDGDMTGSTGSGSDFWVLKLNSIGAIQWQNNFGGSNCDENAFSIKQTNDGGFIVVGQSCSSSGDRDITNNHGNYDLWVTKIDNLGNLQWQNSFGGSGNESAFSVSQTADNGYLLSGRTTSINDGDVSGNHGTFDCWLIKLNSAGSLIWQKPYGGSSIDASSASQLTYDGGVIFTGITYSNNGDVSGYRGGGDVWVVKLRTLTLPVVLDKFNCIKSNDNILVFWQTKTEINSNHFIVEQSIDGSAFYGIATIKAAGNSNTPVHYSIIDSTILHHAHSSKVFYRLQQFDLDGRYYHSKIISTDIPTLSFDAQVVGNPVFNTLKIDFSSKVPQDIQIVIADGHGRKIIDNKRRLTTGKSMALYDISNLKTGVYFVVATSLGTGTIKNIKFLKH